MAVWKVTITRNNQTLGELELDGYDLSQYACRQCLVEELIDLCGENVVQEIKLAADTIDAECPLVA